MADISNRQLAEIISQTAEKINSNVLKERKIANELEKTISKFESVTATIQKEMEEARRTPIRLDLSGLNSFYEEKTAENIKRVNSRLKVPHFGFYAIGLSGIFMILASVMIFFSSKSKQEIETEHIEKLKEKYVFISKEDSKLFDDITTWFSQNPKTLQKFKDWRNQKNRQK